MISHDLSSLTVIYGTVCVLQVSVYQLLGCGPSDGNLVPTHEHWQLSVIKEHSCIGMRQHVNGQRCHLMLISSYDTCKNNHMDLRVPQSGQKRKLWLWIWSLKSKELTLIKSYTGQVRKKNSTKRFFMKINKWAALIPVLKAIVSFHLHTHTFIHFICTTHTLLAQRPSGFGTQCFPQNDLATSKAGNWTSDHLLRMLLICSTMEL